MGSVTNILLDQGWSNGSIAGQWINRNLSEIDRRSKNLPLNRTLTADEQLAFNLNISLFDDNVTALLFKGGHGLDFWYLAPAIIGFFNTTSYTAPVLCTYAINGAYGFYPRLLYYVLLAFSLIFRRHIWLSTAALGTAMTYAATAAAHSFALFYEFKFSASPNSHDPIDWGDADLFAIFTVVVAGCIMLTPILNWSITVRENDARPVVAWWGGLMFASAIGCLQVISMRDPTPVTYGSTAICQRGGLPDCNNGTWWGGDEGYLANRTYYEVCDCIDLCGTILIDVPMRRNQQLSSWLVSEEATMLVKHKSGRTRLINSLALVLVIFQGILGLFESRWTQAEVRNWVFRKLNRSKWHDRFYTEPKDGLELSKNPRITTRIYWSVTTFCLMPLITVHEWLDRRTQSRPWMKRVLDVCVQSFKDLHFVVAKWISASVYLFSVFMAIACPMLFISSVVINEIYVRFYPVSEQNDAVGQWGPWISAVFILVAAVIIKVNSAFWHVIGRAYASLVHFVRLMRGSQSPHSEAKIKKTGTDTLGGAVLSLLIMGWSPFHHAYQSTIIAYVRAVDEAKEFVEWWQDPVLNNTWDWVGKDERWWEDMTAPGEYFTSESKPYKASRGDQKTTEYESIPSQDVAAMEEAVSERPFLTVSSPRSRRHSQGDLSVDLGRNIASDGAQGVEMEDMSLLRGDGPCDDEPPDRRLV